MCLSFTCILSHYTVHEIPKEFWKNSHFENMTAGFLLRCQNSLWWEISLICHWNIDSWKQKIFFRCIIKLLMKHWYYHPLPSSLHKFMFDRLSLDHWPSVGITRATYQASNAQFSNPLETHKCIYLGIEKWLMNIAIVNPISKSPNICLAA